MATDPGIGYKIVGVVTDVKGECSAGHKVGDKFNISCYDCGGLCGFFYHDSFPNLMTFQFGGTLPWWEGDTITVKCPDMDNQVTVKLERFDRPDNLHGKE